MSDKNMPRAEVKVIQSSFDTFQSPIKKSEKSEQLDPAVNVSASEWIPHRIDMNGLRELVETSTILPQCIKAYKNNIAGFGISVEYIDDIEENEETKAEWTNIKVKFKVEKSNLKVKYQNWMQSSF